MSYACKDHMPSFCVRNAPTVEEWMKKWMECLPAEWGPFTSKPAYAIAQKHWKLIGLEVAKEMQALCECQPDCAGKECGSDTCGGSCGKCPPGYACLEGLCQCVPDCTGKECGDDGCGGSCGECPPGYACNPGGKCEWIPCEEQCGDLQCGSAGPQGECDCGECPPGYACANGTCHCVPDCAGKECGDDGCGGSCGKCGKGFCTPTGSCSCVSQEIWNEYIDLINALAIEPLLELSSLDTLRIIHFISDLECGDTWNWDNLEAPGKESLTEDEVREVWARQVATALWNERNHAFPWSLLSYSAPVLKNLLGFRAIPSVAQSDQGYLGKDSAFELEGLASARFSLAPNGTYRFNFPVWATNPLHADKVVKDALSLPWPLDFESYGLAAGPYTALRTVRNMKHPTWPFKPFPTSAKQTALPGCKASLDTNTIVLPKGQSVNDLDPALFKAGTNYVSQPPDYFGVFYLPAWPEHGTSAKFCSLVSAQVLVPAIPPESTGFLVEVCRALNVPICIGKLSGALGQDLSGEHGYTAYFPGSELILMTPAHPWAADKGGQPACNMAAYSLISPEWFAAHSTLNADTFYVAVTKQALLAKCANYEYDSCMQDWFSDNLKQLQYLSGDLMGVLANTYWSNAFSKLLCSSSVTYADYWLVFDEEVYLALYWIADGVIGGDLFNAIMVDIQNYLLMEIKSAKCQCAGQAGYLECLLAGFESCQDAADQATCEQLHGKQCLKEFNEDVDECTKV